METRFEYDTHKVRVVTLKQLILVELQRSPEVVSQIGGRLVISLGYFGAKTFNRPYLIQIVISSHPMEVEEDNIHPERILWTQPLSHSPTPSPEPIQHPPASPPPSQPPSQPPHPSSQVIPLFSPKAPIDLPSSQDMQRMETLAKEFNLKQLQHELDKYNHSFSVIGYIIDFSFESLLKLDVLVYLERIFRTQKLAKTEDLQEILNWMMDWAKKNSETELLDTQNLFAIVVAVFFKYQWPHQQTEEFIREVHMLMQGPIYMIILGVKIFQCILDFAQEGKSVFERELIKRGVNDIMDLGICAFSECLCPPSETFSKYTLKYDMELTIEIAYSSLKLIKDCICYDFFRTRRDDPENDFLHARCPLLIPMKYDTRYQDYTKFELIKEDNLIREFKFLYETVDNRAVRILVVELLGDFMRIQPRFFSATPRDERQYLKAMNYYLCCLSDIGRTLRLTTSDDYHIAQAYASSLNKALTILSIHKIVPHILKTVVMGVSQFLSQKLLDKGLISIKLVSPFLKFLQKVNKFKNLNCYDLQLVFQKYVRVVKTKFINVFLDVIDARKKGTLSVESSIYEIKMEMNQDPLLDEELMRAYLEVVVLCPPEEPYDTGANFDIQILEYYARFEELISALQDPRSKIDKQEAVADLHNLVNTILSALDVHRREQVEVNSRGLDTLAKIRILLLHVVRKLVLLHLTLPHPFPYNLLLKEVIMIRHIDYAIILSLIICVFRHNLPCPEVKHEIMEYITLQDRHHSEEQLMVSIKLFVILADISQLKHFLTTPLNNYMLKCVSCLEGIERSRQLGKFEVVMEWFFKHHYLKVKEGLAGEDKEQLTLAVFTAEMVFLCLKIDSYSTPAQLDYPTFFNALAPLFINCVNIFSQVPEEESENYNHSLRRFLYTVSKMLQLGIVWREIKGSPHFTTIKGLVPKLVLLVDNGSSFLDRQRCRSKVSEFLELTTLSSNWNNEVECQATENIIVKLLPHSLPLAHNYLSHSSRRFEVKIKFLQRVVRNTLESSYELDEWKSFLHLYNNHRELTSTLENSSESSLNYFCLVRRLEEIKIRGCRQELQLIQSIMETSLDQS